MPFSEIPSGPQRPRQHIAPVDSLEASVHPDAQNNASNAVNAEDIQSLVNLIEEQDPRHQPLTPKERQELIDIATAAQKIRLPQKDILKMLYTNRVKSMEQKQLTEAKRRIQTSRDAIAAQLLDEYDLDIDFLSTTATKIGTSWFERLTARGRRKQQLIDEWHQLTAQQEKLLAKEQKNPAPATTDRSPVSTDKPLEEPLTKNEPWNNPERINDLMLPDAKRLQTQTNALRAKAAAEHLSEEEKKSLVRSTAILGKYVEQIKIYLQLQDEKSKRHKFDPAWKTALLAEQEQLNWIHDRARWDFAALLIPPSRPTSRAIKPPPLPISPPPTRPTERTPKGDLLDAINNDLDARHPRTANHQAKASNFDNFYDENGITLTDLAEMVTGDGNTNGKHATSPAPGYQPHNHEDQDYAAVLPAAPINKNPTRIFGQEKQPPRGQEDQNKTDRIEKIIRLESMTYHLLADLRNATKERGLDNNEQLLFQTRQEMIQGAINDIKEWYERSKSQPSSVESEKIDKIEIVLQQCKIILAPLPAPKSLEPPRSIRPTTILPPPMPTKEDRPTEGPPHQNQLQFPDISKELNDLQNILDALKKIPFDPKKEEDLSVIQQLINEINTLQKEINEQVGKIDQTTENKTRFDELVKIDQESDRLTDAFEALLAAQQYQKQLNEQGEEALSEDEKANLRTKLDAALARTQTLLQEQNPTAIQAFRPAQNDNIEAEKKNQEVLKQILDSLKPLSALLDNPSTLNKKEFKKNAKTALENTRRSLMSYNQQSGDRQILNEIIKHVETIEKALRKFKKR